MTAGGPPAREPSGKTLRLFCLPYAGGSMRLFKNWDRGLPGFVDLCPIELPGRGVRFDEPLCTNVDALVEDVLETAKDRLDRPVALFGYSFGALLAFETARRLAELDVDLTCLAVAAFRPPGSPAREDAASFLPDELFRQRLRDFNGTPRELLDNEELMELMLPIIKADFWVADTYVYRPGPPLACPIVAFGSDGDPEVDADEMLGWGRYTDREFSFHRMPGDHFFVNTHQELLLKELSAELTARRPRYEESGR